jgi:hypothetical protein
MRGACRRINTVYRRARTIFRNAANRSRDLRGVSGHVTAHNCECNGLSDGIFRKTPPDFNILPGDATLATQGVVPGVTIICRCRYRCDGTRNQRLPHNDQTQITAVSLSLIKNQLVRTGAQQAQRLRRNADPRSVSNLVGSDTRVCMWRRVRPAANGGEYVGGLRRPIGPFQVTCVVAAAGFAAAFSTTTIDVQACRGAWPRLRARTSSRVADRVDADTSAGAGRS